MSKTGYRALPPFISHPQKSKIYTRDEFEKIKTVKMQEAPSLIIGHKKTIVWYAFELGYIIEVQFDDGKIFYIQSICTFTPTMGMDRIDGLFAEDAEEYIISTHLNFNSQRLCIFNGGDEINIEIYLQSHGFMEDNLQK